MRVLLVLLALTVSLCAVELVRREVIAYRRLERWWDIDAHAIGALLAVVGAGALWAKVALSDPPDGYSALAGLAVILLYVFRPDPRLRER